MGELRDRLRAAKEPAIDPDEFWSLSDDFPYDIQITWSRSGANGDFDVWLRRQPAAAVGPTENPAVRLYAEVSSNGTRATAVVRHGGLVASDEPVIQSTGQYANGLC